MLIHIDKELCVRCDRCAKIAPKVFKSIEENVKINMETLKNNIDEIVRAKSQCPFEAISYQDCKI